MGFCLSHVGWNVHRALGSREGQQIRGWRQLPTKHRYLSSFTWILLCSCSPPPPFLIFVVWSHIQRKVGIFFPSFFSLGFPPGGFRAAAQGKESKARRGRGSTNVSAQVDLTCPWTVPGWAWCDSQRGEVKLRYFCPLPSTIYGSCW